MISFTNTKLYVKGTCQAILSDPCTGQVVYSSNKFQTGNINASVTMGEVRGGMGNSVATVLPSDSALNVEFVAADFSLYAKAAQMGGTMSYGAPAPECQTITATGSTLTLDVSDAVPVAQAGYSTPFAYVQRVGAAGDIESTGTPYAVNPVTGVISGFTAAETATYKVFYFAQRPAARQVTISALFNPATLHFTAQMPVFSNEACATDNTGSRVGWLYVIVPRLKLGANGGVVGDQTTPDTTSISGMAVSYDANVVSDTCSDCNDGVLAYYIYVPDDGAEEIEGLAVIGGTVTVATGESAQIPTKLVMKNGELVTPASYKTRFTYTSTTPPTGTTVSTDGIVNAGSTAGDFDVTVSYTVETSQGGSAFGVVETVVAVSVVES